MTDTEFDQAEMEATRLLDTDPDEAEHLLAAADEYRAGVWVDAMDVRWAA